jgi:hypothetical protein
VFRGDLRNIVTPLLHADTPSYAVHQQLRCDFIGGVTCGPRNVKNPFADGE